MVHQDKNNQFRPRKRLAVLQQRLKEFNDSRTIATYEMAAQSYVRILPEILKAERCSIFVIDPSNNHIASMYGTGLEGKQIEAPRKGSIVGEVIETGQGIIEEDLNKRKGYHSEVKEKTHFETRNLMCVPLKSIATQKVIGAIQILNKKGGESFNASGLKILEEISGHLSMTIESIILNQEVLKLSNLIEEELEAYQKNYVNGVPLVAESSAMINILDTVKLVSKTPVNIYLQGENGTGKELIARMLHQQSDRNHKPFVAVNCAAIPENLVESEFFGYEKGAFTGAEQSRGGYLEEAKGGILFLDEIADMPISAQPKFLRVIQEGEGYRLGSNKLIRYNFRIISASNKDLQEEVRAGRFREDIFFRLFAIELLIPPLRERKDDIIPLATTILDEVCAQFKKKLAGFSPEVLSLFENSPWPGNVRQLRREIERLVALTPAGKVILVKHCSPELISSLSLGTIKKIPSSYSIPDQVKALETQLIKDALNVSNGKKKQAADLLKITRQTLHQKLKRYKIPLRQKDG